jgi:hypothetical protein
MEVRHTVNATPWAGLEVSAAGCPACLPGALQPVAGQPTLTVV